MPEFTSDTELRSNEIIDQILMGDYGGISLTEYLQMAFLCMIDGEELHLETTITFGGAVYNMHACAGAVTAPAMANNLREIQ